MKIIRQIALALAFGSAAPLAAADLAPGEVALHIDAQGFAMADSAEMTVDLTAYGADEGKAKAALRKIEADVTARLGELGIAKAKIAFGDPNTQENYNSDYYYEDVSAGDDATEAAAGAVAYDDSYADTAWQATSAVTVTIEDMAKLGDVTNALLDAYAFTTPQTEYRFADEAGAQRAAVKAAIAKAQADANDYADALGMKVVRIAAVSNAAPDQGFMGFLMQMSSLDRAAADNPMLSNKVAAASVDFVLAPK